MRTPIDEQETIIQISRDGNLARVSTSDSTMMTKLDRLAEDPESDWTLDVITYCGEDICEKTYLAPKSLISFRKAQGTRVMTPEQKAQAAERLRIAREAKLL